MIVCTLTCEKGGVTLRPRDCVSPQRPMVVNVVPATGIEPDPAGKLMYCTGTEGIFASEANWWALWFSER